MVEIGVKSVYSTQYIEKRQMDRETEHRKISHSVPSVPSVLPVNQPM